MINRRSFLGSLLGLGAALVIDPEELIWTPKKTIFIPSSIELNTGWNGFVTTEMITQESLRILKDNLSYTTVMRDYSRSAPLPIGHTIVIRKPQKFITY